MSSWVSAISIAPSLHAFFLGCAAFGSLVIAGIVLARRSQNRMHGVFIAVTAWWFYCMSSSTGSSEAAQFWSRMAQMSIGMLPAIVFHLNISVAGEAYRRATAVTVHWILSSVITVFALTWPGFLDVPHHYSWGYYLAFTPISLVVVLYWPVVVVQSQFALRRAIAREPSGSLAHNQAKAFYYGNMFTFWALLDFVPAFGIAFYPPGYLILFIGHAASLIGVMSNRLIEITPELAAEQILETMPNGLLVVDKSNLIRVANQPAADLIGGQPAELIGLPLRIALRDKALIDALSSSDSLGHISMEVTYYDVAAEKRVIELSSSPLRDASGRLIARVWILHDLTGRRAAEVANRRLEEGVRQAQKLESLGVMAGGIAHDFNNLLMSILGNADLADEALDNPSKITRYLRGIKAGATRASELTNQLLTYAGQRQADRTTVNVNTLVEEMSELMRSAISKKAQLTLDLGDDLPTVVGDVSQVRQVVLNLITNASEALGDETGAIVLRTGTIQGDGSFVGFELENGAPTYVFLEVEDTGMGMSDDTITHMFDPFFTTKFTGRGLGLPTVMGIVRGHAGLTRITSDIGLGTVFTVAFPVGEAAEMPLPVVVQKDLGDWQATGVALLAEDEGEIRVVANEMLQRAGFEVIQAVDGQAAVHAFRAHADEISLVIMDRTMPKMNGLEALAQIRSMSSDVPVVFMSGYSEADQFIPSEDQRISFLHKPFDAAALNTKIREAVATK